MIKKILIAFMAICLLAFSTDKKVKIELTINEANMLIDALRKSRIESWQSADLIDKIVNQVNPQLDTTKQK